MLCSKHGQHGKGVKTWTAVASTSCRLDRLHEHSHVSHHLVAVGMEGQREAAKRSGGIGGDMAKVITLHVLAGQTRRSLYHEVQEPSLPGERLGMHLFRCSQH